VGVAAFIIFASVGLSFLYDYRIGPASIDVLLFRRFPIFRIMLVDIVSVRRMTLGDAFFAVTSLRLSNRLYVWPILIERKRGLFRKVVITPARPDEFMARVETLSDKKRT
jgi:hypothetical protein